MPALFLRFVTNGHLLLLSACAFLGGMAVATKVASQYLPIGEIIFLRFFGGWVILWPLVRSGVIDLRVRNRNLLYWRGVLSAGAIICFFYAIATVPVAHAVLLNNTYPLYIAMLSIPILKERVDFPTVASFGIAFMGIGVMLQPSVAGQHGPFLGYAAGLTSGVIAAGAVMTIRVLRRTDAALTIFYYMSLVGMLISLPLALKDPLLPTGNGMVAILLVIVLSAGGQILLNQAFKYARAAEGSVVMMATTVVAAILGAFVFGDRYTPKFFIGAALIFGSITWLTTRARAGAGAQKAVAPAVDRSSRS